MKKTLVLILAIATIGTALAQQESKVIKQADELVEQQQYESAYRLLDDFDPTNDRVNVMLLKEHIVLNYFVQSVNHMLFSLKDLHSGETLHDVRVNFVQGNIFPFNADSLTIRLLATHPGDRRLLGGHTRFHEAMLDNYGHDLWSTYLDSTCLAMLMADSENAAACYQLGLYYTYVQVDSAECYYRKAITLNDTLYQALYNLGVIEYQLDKLPQTVEHMRRAYVGYRNLEFKADAARVLGIVYDQLGNRDSAFLYYVTAVSIDSSYLNQAFLLNHYLQLQDSRMTTQFHTCWRAAMADDDTYNDIADLVSRCAESGHTDFAISILKEIDGEVTSDYEHALCCLWLGQLVDTLAEQIKYLERAVKHLEAEGAPEGFVNSVKDAIKELNQ